ncbi:MAG: cytochrome c oxidase assembly protein [Pseudomonadota bacterium]|nr:cytochrome c oxidase assembly protein [Pseudomonadota bacterium]
MLAMLWWFRPALAHQGIVMPWDPDEIDYESAPPDAWLALDLHVSVVAGILAFCWLYLQAVGPWRKKYGWSHAPVERWRVAAFLLGQLVLFVSLNGPIHHLSDYFLFSAHMVQHLLLNLVWAPLTVVALPPWLIEAALQVPWVNRVATVLSSLKVKFLLYNGVLYFWHVPLLYDSALKYHPVHIVEHVSFMATAVIAWFGLLCTAPSLPRPKPIFQMLYLFVMTIPMKLLGAIITLADDVIYHGYDSAPRMWGLTPMIDQGYGGLLMWLPGGLVLWGSMIYVFARWVESERAAQKAEVDALRGIEPLQPVQP